MSHTIELGDDRSGSDATFTAYVGPQRTLMAQVTAGRFGYVAIPAEDLDELCRRWLEYRGAVRCGRRLAVGHCPVHPDHGDTPEDHPHG